MGEKIWFYTPSGAETVGPVDIDEIANRIADGTIVGETAVWTKAFGNEWKRADSIYELRFAWKKLESSRVETVSQIPLAIHSLGEAVHASYRYVCALLFKSRRFSLWISLIFCVWMATATALVNVVDVEAFWEKMAGGSNYLSALVVGLSEGLSKIFIPKISLQWVFVVVVFSLITVYVRVKGRLMFVFFAFSPLESLGRAWQKTVGRTRSLLIFYTLLECIVNFTIATCLYHFLYVGGFLDNPSQQTADKVIAALLNLESAKWLIYGTSIFLVVSFVKSFAFHFVEPNIAIFNVPVTTAFRMATLAFAKNSGKFLSYYLFVLVFRLLYSLFVLILLFVTSIIIPLFNLSPSAMIGGLPMFFLVIAGRFLLLPADLFFRVVGTRFLTPGKK